MVIQPFGRTRPRADFRAAEAPAARDPEREGESRRRWLSVLLILVFALLVGLYGSALRDNARLESQVQKLEGDLAGAQARIGAFEVHLDEVRAGVHGLSAELESLEGLLERGPEPPPGT